MAMTGPSSSGLGGSTGGHGNSQSSNSASSLSSKESFNALFAQTSYADAQAFIKQHQRLIQQLPPNSAQRKTYEALLAEMKQAAEQR